MKGDIDKEANEAAPGVHERTTPLTHIKPIAAGTPPAIKRSPWNGSGKVRLTTLTQAPSQANGSSSRLSRPREASAGAGPRINRSGTSVSSDPNIQGNNTISNKNSNGATRILNYGGSKEWVGAKNSQLCVRVVGQSKSIIPANLTPEPPAGAAEMGMGQLQLSKATRAKVQLRGAHLQHPSPSATPMLKNGGGGGEAMWIPLDVREARRQTMARSNTSDLFLWRTGPADTSGLVLDLSDRNLMCMSVRGTEAAIGCADHSVYTVDAASGKILRNLYNKTYGHTEWVTCVEHLNDGRILSGALDKKLCLWDATGVRCTDLTGHDASISAVKVVDSTYAISSSYDKSLMLWNLAPGPRGQAGTTPVGCLRGHKGAILGFAVSSEGSLMSGSRDGEVFLWDATSGKAVLRCKNAHQGHVTVVECLRDIDEDCDNNNGNGQQSGMFAGCLGELFLTGGQDGIIQVWDVRSKAPVHTFAVSRSEKGRGAVSNIRFTSIGARTPPLMVTACADKVIRVLEPRSSFRTVHTSSEHKDFIYSLHLCGPLMWSGAGDGKMLVHDLTNGRCLYGLGATENGAVRCISLAGPRHLVVAGDDGNCMLYSV